MSQKEKNSQRGNYIKVLRIQQSLQLDMDASLDVKNRAWGHILIITY